MGRKELDVFKKMVLDELAARPAGQGLNLNALYVETTAREIDDDDVRAALAEMLDRGQVHQWNLSKKLWQTELFLGPRPAPKRKAKGGGQGEGGDAPPEAGDR